MIDLKHVVLKLTLFVYLYISVFVYLHLCACDSNAFYFTNIEPTLYVRVGEMAVSKQVAFSNTVCQTTAQSLSWHKIVTFDKFDKWAIITLSSPYEPQNPPTDKGLCG